MTYENPDLTEKYEKPIAILARHGLPEKYLEVSFSNGQVYTIPAIVIAHNAAEYYSTEKGEDYEELLVDYYDDDLVLDWAPNNMYWSELKPFAILKPQNPTAPYDFDRAFGEATLAVIV